MVATLLGAVSSDQLEDGRVVSGAGGQHDLVAMAHALEGARSIIGVRSTRRQNRRTVSNIVWRYANATVPRQLRDIVVTEYGIADLRGKSDRDVIVEMLAGRRQRLPARADRGGAKRRQARAPLRSCRLLRPATGPSGSRRRLAPARRDGLLPAFPLGTEMTEVEQALAGPLTSSKSAGYADLVRMLFAGLGPQARHRPRAGRARSACARLAGVPARAGRCAPWCWARCGEVEPARQAFKRPAARRPAPARTAPR